MRDVTLRQLRALLTVEKFGKIASAANVLGVTPQAVTLQLKLLEEMAGLPLLERSKAGMRPTDAGIVVREAANRIAALIDDCGRTLGALKSGGGIVHLGVVSTAKYFAPRALAAFAAAHPGIELRLSVGNRAKTLEALSNLEIDIAITGYPPADLDVIREPIGDHPHVIIAHPGHAFATSKTIKLAELAALPFLVREQGSGTRALMENLFEASGVAHKIGMEIDSNETIKQAVMAGLGIAFISAHTIAAELESGRLCILPVKGLPVIRTWYAVQHEEKRLLPAAQAMWQFLISERARLLPKSEIAMGNG